jgi:type VI secretion system protein ImpA
MPINAELVAACLAPISADAPSGAELRYDARLDDIKEARREEDLPGSERKLADWNTVIARCSTLLQKETKDLQLAAWLTEALLRRQGFGGMLTGVSVVRGLLEQFWDTVYPLPEDGDLEMRVAPVEWVGAKLLLPIRLAPCLGRLSCADLDAARAIPSEADAKGDSDKQKMRAQAIDAGRPTPEDVEAEAASISKAMLRTGLADIVACIAELEQLEKFGDEKFGRDAPSFNSVRNALDEPRRVLQNLLTQKLLDDPDPVEEVMEESGEAAATDPDAPLTPEPVSAADASQRVAVVARWLRQQNKANPAPYLMLRAYRWGELLNSAPDVEPRLLEAPPTAVRTRLRSLMLDGKWAELLEAAESLMATPAGRGWLDLQRYALTACSNLGAEYDAVAGGMRSELRALLRAVPQLPRMTLMDETPTANDATREWIAQEITADTVADGAATPSDDGALDATPSDGSELLETALQEDAATAQLGGLAKAKAVHPSAARGGRDVFAAARAELAQNRPQRAIELLMAELTRDQSPRGRFLRQTQIAYIMVEAGLNHVAQPLLQQLVEQIDEQKLEQWESGPLVAQPLALLHRVLVKSGTDPRQQEALYLRVCRLDPIQAMTLQAP